MRSARRWLVIAALALAAAWLHELAGVGSTLLALSDAVRKIPVPARDSGDRAPLPPKAPRAESTRATPDTAPRRDDAAESVYHVSPRQIAADGLTAEQIRRLLEDELESDADPAAAGELLREFDAALDGSANVP